MPYRRRYKCRYNRRKYSKKRRTYRKKPIVVTPNDDFKSSLGRMIVPRRLTTKLVYSTKFTLNAVTGNHFYNSYRGNNIYDPDYTLAGHQPRGYDQLATLYKQYRVNGCKIELIACTPAQTDAGCIEIVVFPTNDPDNLATTDPEQLAEQPGAGLIVLSPGVQKKISSYYSTSQAFGISKIKARNDDAYAGAFGSGPSSEWYFQLVGQVSDENTTMDAFLYVKLTYYVTVFDPIQLVAS